MYSKAPTRESNINHSSSSENPYVFSFLIDESKSVSTLSKIIKTLKNVEQKLSIFELQHAINKNIK